MLSFEDLRKFAETHVTTRAWIEQIKDDIVEDLTNGCDVPALSFRRILLLRGVLEDLLVCGATCLEGGELVDVGTISLLFDAQGNTPSPPAPAYMQTIKGRAAIYLTANQLNYIRLRDEGVYPCSPIEKVMQIKAEIRRVFLDEVHKHGVGI